MKCHTPNAFHPTILTPSWAYQAKWMISLMNCNCYGLLIVIIIIISAWICTYILSKCILQWCTLYRKSPAGSHVAYPWRWLVKWVHKPWLIWWKCFPDDRLQWLVSEAQHFPIYVKLQAAACRWGWLISWIMFSKYRLGHSPWATSGCGIPVLQYRTHLLIPFFAVFESKMSMTSK